MYDHILVSTDGSELAQRGVDHALSLARALSSKLTVVTAIEPMGAAAYGEGWLSDPEAYRRYEDDRVRSAQAALSTIRSTAQKMGVDVETVHVTDKRPAAAILETAEALGCSLIVMSSHGRRGVSRMLLGSQTAEVLVQSPIPVLVVR